MPASVIAPIAGAVIGGGASLLSSSNASSAAQQATAAQSAASQAAIAEQQREFDTQQKNLQPWLTAGTNALSSQSDLLGLNGAGAQQNAISSLQSSPLYQSLFNTGQNTVLNNAAATGGLRGGNATNSLYNLGQSTLASVIQNQLSNLGAISNTGQGTGTALGQLGGNSASAIASLLQQQGATTGGGILSSALAGNKGISGVSSSLTSLLNNPSVLSALGGSVSSPSLDAFVANANNQLFSTPTPSIF